MSLSQADVTKKLTQRIGDVSFWKMEGRQQMQII